MHILLTNDDGIDAPGIRQLTLFLTAKGHRVTLAAPDRERSAVAHAISITPPLRAKEISRDGATGWAIDGTPTDCARLGMYLTRNDRPDICVSGINRGPNLGGACIYSGTVNAAMEASMTGCPAIAASLNSFTQNDYSLACEYTGRLIDYAVKHPLERGEIYNLNVPAGDYVRGLYFTSIMAPEYLTDAAYQEFTSSYNNKYYFLIDGANGAVYPPECDYTLVKQGWAAVSALTWDLSVKDKGRVRENGKIEES